jgi:rhodanese-related sulfurtransferase
MQQMTPTELAAWLSDDERDSPVLLDVREPQEFAICRIEGSLHIPMNTVPARLAELDREREMVVICHHGMRSMQVAMFLQRQGFSKVLNLAGGVAAWAAEVDPAMPRY